MKNYGLETPLDKKVAFKISGQLGGTVGQKKIKNAQGVVENKGGVEVACAPKGVYGLILCETKEALEAVLNSTKYKKGMIVPIEGSEDMHRTDIMGMNVFNPDKVTKARSYSLLKYFTAEDLDKIDKLGNDDLLGLHKAVMNAVDKKVKPEVLKTEPEKDKPAEIRPPNKSAIAKQAEERLMAIRAELGKLGVVYAKKATTKVLEELLRENDPTNALLPQPTKEALERELKSNIPVDND